jgi:transposase-like protein
MDQRKRQAAEAVKRGGDLREVARQYGISLPTLLDARRKYAPRTVRIPLTPEEREARTKAQIKEPQVRYPWDRWLSQPRTILVRGRDYHCTTLGMVQQVRLRAYKSKVRVSVHTTQDSVTIELRRD